MTTSPRTLLAATDFSARGDSAVRRAALLAAQHKARLEIVHVLHGLGSTAWWSESLRDDDDEVLARRSRERLQDLAKRLSAEYGIEVATTQLRGSVAAVLTAHAAKTHARMIVLGATGAGAVARRLLGSSTQAVLRSSHVPVLVVRNRAENDYRKVVFATDFSEGADAAVTEGLALAPGANTVFFSALDAPRSRIEPALGLDELTRATKLQEAREATRDRLGTLAARMGHDGAGIIVRDGRASEELPVLVHEVGADLLCLGSEPHPALERWMLGSTSAHAVAEAECDVLVVPHTSS
ncbi:universal stress protein [Alkalisalibacterium limincola]|uniref:Universal stress protein n=1 Tax=Alkalisalibacterium limincola TaxID=2699169 RepID=A0A5C8KVB4_9GAMM|nr:universal stress protein [Alkalisalibacterium limincola]TXK65974.1 universal stress protein [Alkalisalibacterium limincola]